MTTFVPAGEALLPELRTLRRQLHHSPEVGLHLPQTQRAVLDALAGLPIELSTGTRTTSVTGVLHGSRPGPVVLLRGDMDALPIREDTGLDYASDNGAMHACGHDLHVAALVGAARLLAARRESLAGSVVFMFQPGEEGDAGAQVMLEEGVLEAAGRPVDAAYGTHVYSNRPKGIFQTRPGALMASSHSLTITVEGRGGHGGRPHQALDPVPVLAQIILAIQSYVARQISVFDPVVISVTQLSSVVPINVIPSVATLRAEIRALSRENVTKLHEELPRLASGIASAFGMTASTTFDGSYPVTINDPAETANALRSLRGAFGDERVPELKDPVMGSEDFSYVLERVPGAFIFLGAQPADVEGEGPSNHSSAARFDDDVLGDQAAALAQLAFDRMSDSREEKN
jgi:hippurate hydrolase